MALAHADQSSRAFVLLNPADNVLVCARDAMAGEEIMIDGKPVRLAQDVMLGHKIARTALHAGDKVLRYGAPIGSITCDVGVGQHVHSHNLASDYIPAHGRGGSDGGAA